MKARFTVLLGYGWAALALPLAAAALAHNEALARAVVSAAGLRVSPRFTGGEPGLEIRRKGYIFRVRKPVFAGLSGERESGFVQVEWVPSGDMPPLIREEVGLPGGISVVVTLDTVSDRAWYGVTEEFSGDGPKLSRLDSGWAARISVRKNGVAD